MVFGWAEWHILFAYSAHQTVDSRLYVDGTRSLYRVYLVQFGCKIPSER